MSETGIVAEIFVVGLTPAERMMGELEMRRGSSLCKDGAAHSRAEGQHDLDSTTSDDPEALHLGVVEQTSWLSKETRDLRFQRPCLFRIGGWAAVDSSGGSKRSADCLGRLQLLRAC